MTWHRPSLAEAFAITPVPVAQDTNSERFISHYPPWKLGTELPMPPQAFGAFGGTVYGQAALAAARTHEKRTSNESDKDAHMGIFSIQGVFTRPATQDRPFVHDVTPIQNGRSFAAYLTSTRQSTQPSSIPKGPFPVSDANLPLNEPCFTCITTMGRPRESQVSFQQPVSAQQMYHSILSQRAPDEWDSCPQVDLEPTVQLFPNAGHGAFPILDMYKVDMMEFNKDKPYTDRRELLFYRPHKPIAQDDPNAHIAAHAYASDRNGLLMLANHVGFARSFKKAATLSYSFYVHSNASEAVMDDKGWWLLEFRWTRADAERCIMETKVWSPDGKHIASGYQDGVLSAHDTTKVKL